MRGFLILAYAIAIGFVVSGLASSLYQLITSEPARFAMPGKSFGELVLTGLFFAVSGPMLVFRAIAAGRRDSGNPPGWMVAGVVLCLIWSCSSGLLLLDIAVSVLRST